MTIVNLKMASFGIYIYINSIIFCYNIAFLEFFKKFKAIFRKI
jgi:hypothetical protein